jgi:CheY-like chemotaxis protein
MSAANAQTPLSILVVEDEVELRSLIVSFLREAGCAVSEAASAEEAIALMDKQVDAVITDLRLGGRLTGWDVAEACRQVRADFPVIYVSGNIVEPPRPVPGSLFFHKPYSPDEILQACHRLSGAGSSPPGTRC